MGKIWAFVTSGIFVAFVVGYALGVIFPSTGQKIIGTTRDAVGV